MVSTKLLAHIRAGRLHAFYTSSDWLRLRESVLASDHFECQHCKDRGRYTRATTVHHVNYVRKHPELALSTDYQNADGQQRRNLISLCHNCHEAVHNHRNQPGKQPLTEEMW